MKIDEKIDIYLGINEGWMKHGNVYSAEAFDLDAFWNKKHKDPRCRNVEMI